MRAAIQRVVVAGFRGILCELTVDLDGRSLLLRGDNGSGKSSVAQAIRWALTGTPTGHGTGLPEEFVRHRLLAADESPRVTIELSNGGRIDIRGSQPEADDEGAAFRDACTRANWATSTTSTR